MKKIGLAVLGSTVVCCAASLTAGGQQTTVPDKYVLQWSDDFSGSFLDSGKWNYRTDVKAFSAQRPDNISLDGAGHMNIALRQEEYAGKHFTGGGIASKANFRYGYYEVQAKTTEHRGWHTAFWMFAGDGRTVPPKFPPISNASTEIDVLEVEDPSDIDLGVNEWQHGQNLSYTRCNRHFSPGFSTAAAYHTYGAEWTEEAIKYYLDGKLICAQQYPASQAPHDRINIWLTSIGFKKDLNAAGQPSPASFGRVAYYIRDYYLRNNEPGYAEYGTEWVDGILPGYSRLGSRSSCSPSDFAVWTPTILAGGDYSIQIYRAPNPRYDNASRITIHSRNNDESKTVDFKSGVEGWLDLGTYSLDKGSGNSVTIANSGHGCTYADIVKFVRQ
jgi:hypothetical protein